MSHAVEISSINAVVQVGDSGRGDEHRGSDFTTAARRAGGRRVRPAARQLVPSLSTTTCTLQCCRIL